MAAISTLAATSLDDNDLIHAALDLVEQVVESPYMGLFLHETGHTEEYVRIGAQVDDAWAAEVTAPISELQRKRFLTNMTVARPITDRLSMPAAWVMTFPATVRSGRAAALALACPQPLTVSMEEEQLMMRLARQVLLVLDHARLLQQLESVEVMDGLTGIANHRRMLETLEYEMRRHRYDERRLALVVLDIEGLDGINRNYGRRYGNHILKKLATLLQEVVRPIDTVARYGLDEFALILPGMDEEEGRELAERLRAELVTMEFAGGAVGVSIGVAQASPTETLTAESFLLRGERALLEAKRHERDWRAMLKPGGTRAARP